MEVQVPIIYAGVNGLVRRSCLLLELSVLPVLLARHHSCRKDHPVGS